MRPPASPRIRVAGLCALALLPLHGARAQSISGAVVDSRGAPLAGATVSLIVESGGCPSAVVTSDDAGTFRFEGTGPGRYRVRAAKPGYVTLEFGEVERGTPGFGAPVLLTPAAPDATLRIALVDGSEVSGLVLDEDREPLAGGYVFFEDPEITSQSFFARTDESGRYRVTDLHPGRYRISARRFSPEANQVVGDRWYFPGTTDENSARLVALGATAARADIWFGSAVPSAGLVRVLTAAGDPVQQAEVSVQRIGAPSEPWNHLATLRTGPDGRAEVRILPPGEYLFSLSKVPPPYAAWRDPGAGRASVERYAKRIRVAEGGPQASVLFEVSPALELACRFEMRDGGAPLPAHRIGLDLLSAPEVPGSTGSLTFLVPPARMDGDGCLFQGLVAGERYTLREFPGDPLRPFVIVELRLAGRALSGDDIELRPDEPDRLLRIVLDRAAVISGEVRGLPDATRLTARRIGGGAPPALHPAETDAEIVGGRFVLRGLTPGRYRLSPSGSERSLEIEVKPGDVLDVSF